MSSTTFQLESLPLIPLYNFLEMMYIHSLIELTKCNKSLKTFLQKGPIQSGGYQISMDEFGSSIEMFHQEFRYYWNRKEKSNLLEMVLGCYRYLESVFPGGINHLKVCPTYSEFFDRLPKTCQILSVGQESEINTEWDLESMENDEFSNLDVLLNHVDFQKGLSLNGPMKMMTENEKMFRIDWLKINNSEWMTSRILGKLKNKIIYLSKVSFNEEEMNGFILDLKKNGNDQLEIMSIERNGKWNEEEVMKGLEASRVGKKQKYFIENYNPIIRSENFLPYCSGNEITVYDAYEFRRADGVRCSIEIKYSTIRIFIWNQKKKEWMKRRGSTMKMSDEEPVVKKNC